MQGLKCCLCRADSELEEAVWPLPPESYQCRDHIACRQRVRDIVLAHQQWSEMHG